MAVSTYVSPAKEVDVTKPTVTKSQATTTKPTKSKKKSLLKELKADAKAFHVELEGGLRGADAEIEAGLRAIGRILRFKKKGKGKSAKKNVEIKKVYSRTESDSPASDDASETSKKINDKPASSRNLSDFDVEVVESPKMAEKDEKLDAAEEVKTSDAENVKTADVEEEKTSEEEIKTSDVEEEKTSDVEEDKTPDVENEQTNHVEDKTPDVEDEQTNHVEEEKASDAFIDENPSEKTDTVVGEQEIVVEAEESMCIVSKDVSPDVPAMEEEEEIVHVERSVDEIVAAEAEKLVVSKSNSSTYLSAGAVLVLAATPLLFMRSRR